jgi:hypothetical protein
MYNAGVVVGKRVFFKVEENIFAYKTYKATRGVVNFHSAEL